MEEKQEEELNIEFQLIAKEMDKVSDTISETLTALGMKDISSIEINRLPLIFAVMSKKLEENNKKKNFTFAQVRINSANGHKLCSINPEAKDIKVNDWVCITKIDDLEGVNQVTVPDLMNKLASVEDQPLIPPYDEQTKLKNMGVKMSENGMYMKDSMTMKDLNKYLEKVDKKLREEEAEETMEYYIEKFRKKTIRNNNHNHSDSNISDEEIKKMGEFN